MAIKNLIPKKTGLKNSYYEAIYSNYKEQILEYDKPNCFVCGEKVNCITEGDLIFHITCFKKVKKYYKEVEET